MSTIFLTRTPTTEFRVSWHTLGGEKSCVFRTLPEARRFANAKMGKRTGMVIEDIRVAS